MSLEYLINYDTLKSSSIQDSVGNTYGSVHDLVLNRETGKVEFLVVGSGGVLGIGRDYFVVPFQAVDLSSNANKVILNTNKEKVENAPRFKNEDISKWSEKERNELLTYYGFSRQTSPDDDNLDNREPSLADKKHQGYEGSSQITDTPINKDSVPGENVNYDKMKGTESGNKR